MNDTELIAFGEIYLRSVAFSFLAMSLSQMYLSVLKSTVNSKLSAWISSSSLIINIVLDALCVFVLFPERPEMAIAGVAIATVIARLMELSWCFLHSLTKGNTRFHLPIRDDMEKQLKKDFIKYTLPVQANYIVWGGALTATGFASAFIWHFSPIWIYVIISLDEFVKLPAAVLRYRQYKWLKNITRKIT
jgi:Na+-driven multidrug efflux pump